MLTLDGSTLEGGGQLVRVALSLSAICEVPVHIYNIRAGRGAHSFQKQARDSRRNQGGRASQGNTATAKQQKPGGGLKESHLAALRWLALECHAKVDGAEIGSQELTFRPTRRKGGHQTTRRSKAEGNGSKEVEVIELKNPGSVWLIWQAIFPYIVFSMLRHRGSERSETPPFRIRLKGGTNVPKSPSSEYMQQVLLPLCERIGLPKVDIQVLRRGWTTGAAEIGEVEIAVFDPKQSWGDSEEMRPKADGLIKKEKGKSREHDVQDGGGFVLDPFQLTTSGPITVTSISMTILAGSSQTHSLVQSQLLQSLRAIPAFSSLSLPVQLHSSSADSGDERRLYILLVAHTFAGHTLGRDYLSPGRKVTNEKERQRTVDEAVGNVVRAFARECTRGSCVDEFAEDQLVIFQALADGASSVDVGKSGQCRNMAGGAEAGSLHTRTVRWVCREMLGTVFDGQGRCEGRGMKREEGDFHGLRDELEVLSIAEDHDEKD
ncbi:uncharacterized protein Z520_09874 [Fonsecaea multimorphosa CBS 102226]|uniref:RNA 3'-terminal phosphate cyclase domain-containing protein n=1 Tax=Fonsecaea multimorphosa CBS 102226 TaxID=1442371 RepID=A0A0D2KCQ2_9EURO|nr:uncharacterized protein Z520_09874 [Fonsecaea multimorphosa CBS 102226]KIX94488.1 hypothetical protein Z520_09874 [Fonsecaea multimorphosa CBS 102226]OAL20066.1 hypothetical protein AYO22_09216 [Fonsecaea multimorphosa]